MKLTQLFPQEVKPVHVGVYEPDYDGFVGYSFWDGEKWGDTRPNPINASTQGRFVYGGQKKRWRGLATKPRSKK